MSDVRESGAGDPSGKLTSAACKPGLLLPDQLGSGPSNRPLSFHGVEEPTLLSAQAIASRDSRTKSTEDTSWSPMKYISTNKSKSKKLSESRGVHLPEIKLLKNNFGTPSTGNETSTAISPPLTNSPLGQVIMKQNYMFDSSNARLSDASLEKQSRNMLDIRVFLPSGKGLQFTVEGGRIATAGALLKLVTEHLDISNQDFNVFTLWMCSSYLEIQLKPHHVPFQVRLCWVDLLAKFVCGSKESAAGLVDEPQLILRRNVILSLNEQRRLLARNNNDIGTSKSNLIANKKVLQLLYEDARDRVVSGYYLCDLQDSLQLAAISMALELGPYNERVHTSMYIKNRLDQFMPMHQINLVRSHWLFDWPLSTSRSAEKDLIYYYKLIRKINEFELQRRYLELCEQLPFYGGAFFYGQVEQPSHLWSRLFYSNDISVRIVISRPYISIVDVSKNTVLLSVPIMDCNWTKIYPKESELSDCLPSFFLHFPDPQDDSKSKLLQIFTRQAVLIDALLLSCVEACLLEDSDDNAAGDDNSKTSKITFLPAGDTENVANEESDQQRQLERLLNGDDCMRFQRSSTLRNKIERLCLATFNQEGKCVEATGSLQACVGKTNIEHF